MDNKAFLIIVEMLWIALDPFLWFRRLEKKDHFLAIRRAWESLPS